MIRPARLCGEETRAIRKTDCGEQHEDVRSAMQIQVRSEHIRGTTRVAQASKKITERRYIGTDM